jgi:hypothetical protein
LAVDDLVVRKKGKRKRCLSWDVKNDSRYQIICGINFIAISFTDRISLLLGLVDDGCWNCLKLIILAVSRRIHFKNFDLVLGEATILQMLGLSLIEQLLVIGILFLELSPAGQVAVSENSSRLQQSMGMSNEIELMSVKILLREGISVVQNSIKAF